jgi:hypothetical protein
MPRTLPTNRRVAERRLPLREPPGPRPDGAAASIVDIRLPVPWQTSLRDDWVGAMFRGINAPATGKHRSAMGLVTCFR